MIRSMQWFPAAAVILWCGAAAMAQQNPPPEGREIEVKSTLDGEVQKCILYIPSNYDPAKPAPLLVTLHSWGGNYREKGALAIPEAERRGWIALMPDYRNGNNQPKACASPFAVQDVVDAIEHVGANYNLDRSRIYLIGASGGGHMALVLAARHPEIWAAVSVWCPISDLVAWHREHRPENSRVKKEGFSAGILRNLERVCGGPPGAGAAVDREYAERSPIHFIEKAKDVRIQINHGEQDDLVDVHHGQDAFERLKAAGAARATLNIFAGGHTLKMPEAAAWVEAQGARER